MPNMPYMQGAPIYAMPRQPQMQMPPQVQMQPQPRYAMPASASQPQAKLPPPPPEYAANNLKPKVRAQAPDVAPPAPPAPPRIVVPSPEALGIQVTTGAPKVAVDWNHVHTRLEQLGIANLRRDRLPQGGFRVVLALAGQQIEGTGATEAAAMMTALQRAEALAPAPR